MKKRGFTLIELLAVIIILAIVALVATPIILNVVNDAKRSAGLSEAKMIYSGINNYCMEARLKEQLNGIESICKDGVTVEEVKQMVNLGNSKVLEVEYDGKVTKLKVESNNQVVELQTDGTFTINGETTGDPVTPPTESRDLVSTLLEQYDESNTVGFLKDDTGYYYKGTNTDVANNFVWFGGHLWRVISIDNENNLTMITQQPITTIQPARNVWTTQADYEASYINHWLNDETDGVFLKSMDQDDKDKIQNSTFNVGIYTNISEITTTQKVGLLNETQYTKAGGQNSYLDIKDGFWLGNRYNTARIRNVAYNGNLNGDTYLNTPADTEGVRPVIKISNLTFTTGKGTQDDPYRVSSTTTNTSNIKVGEYISIPTSGTDCGEDKKCLFRVVNKDNNSIKVILNGLLPTESAFGSNTKYTSGNTVDTVVTTFANTISNTYRYTENDKTFGIETYPRYDGIGANYTTLQNTTYTGNVGLPVMGEMFSGNDINATTSSKTFVNVATIENPIVSNNFWTMNPYYSGRNVRFASGGYSAPSKEYGVRPVLFLNNNLTFTGGEGTAEHPFVLK